MRNDSHTISNDTESEFVKIERHSYFVLGAKEEL